MITFSIAGYVLVGFVFGIVVFPRLRTWVSKYTIRRSFPTCANCSKAIMDWNEKGTDLGHDLGLCSDCQTIVKGPALIADIERLIAHDQKIVDERGARISRLKGRLADLKNSQNS